MFYEYMYERYAIRISPKISNNKEPLSSPQPKSTITTGLETQYLIYNPAIKQINQRPNTKIPAPIYANRKCNRNVIKVNNTFIIYFKSDFFNAD